MSERISDDSSQASPAHESPLADGAVDHSDMEFAEVDPTGRYGRYDEILGKGSSKTVYRAFDEIDGIEVAWNQVKVQDLLQSPEDLERLYSEVHLLKSLKHKNILKFYSSWVDIKTKNVNFITEIFTSGTLRQYRKKHKYVDLKAVKNWARQILRGLLYLHSHDPPIIHRDLKCDNIFINGNHGEVKIGDLGLAAVLRQAHAAHSVIGTPEFMAPELYEEEYNELVDIYSFGMCLLEMVTFEYPYSECANAAQIYKKVTSGKKPAALDRVKDLNVRAFVAKCLESASRRLPARELLMDPFLQCDGDLETFECIRSVSHSDSRADGMECFHPNWEESCSDPPDLNNLPQTSLLDEKLLTKMVKETEEGTSANAFSNSLPSDLDGTNSKEGVGFDQVNKTLPGTTGCSKLPLSASLQDEITGRIGDLGAKEAIFLRLRVADSKGHVRNIHFPFDVENDTALNVASEMVTELNLSDQDATTVAGMIDAEILAIIPDWKPGADSKDNAVIEESIKVEEPRDKIGKRLTTLERSKSMPLLNPILDRLPSPWKSYSPKMKFEVDLSSLRMEGTMHGRFEEVIYGSKSAENACTEDVSLLLSSDLREDAGHLFRSDLIEFGCFPPKSHSSNSKPDQAHIMLPEACAGNADSDFDNSVDFNKLVESRRNADCDKYTHETWAEISDRIEYPPTSDDEDEEYIALELKLLAVRHEQELKDLQRKHEDALLEVRHRCRTHRKRSPKSPLQISPNKQRATESSKHQDQASTSSTYVFKSHELTPTVPEISICSLQDHDGKFYDSNEGVECHPAKGKEIASSGGLSLKREKDEISSKHVVDLEHALLSGGSTESEPTVISRSRRDLELGSRATSSTQLSLKSADCYLGNTNVAPIGMTIQQGTWLAKDVTEKNFLQRYGMATELAAEGSDMAFKKGGSGGSEFSVRGDDDSDQFDNKSGPVMKLEKSNLHHLLSLRSGTSSTGEVVMDFCGRGVGSNQLRGQKTPTIGLSFPQDGCASELNSNLLFPAADELFTENDQIVEGSLHTSDLQTTLPSQQKEFLKEAMCTLLERVSEPLETLDQADKVVLVEASSPQPFRTTQSSSFLHTDSINKESAFVNASSALVQGNMPVNDECVVQKKRESYLELYEGGGSDRRRFPSSSSSLKSSECSENCEAIKLPTNSNNEVALIARLKKEQLQRCIAEMEAKTLEGLNQSKVGIWH